MSANWIVRQAAVNLFRRPDLNFVLPDLAVGAQFPTRAIPVLADLGFTSIVDLRGEARPAYPVLTAAGISALHLRVRDGGPPTSQQLDAGVRWIEAELAAGGRVLVHCRAGVGRSVLTVCAFLTHQGLTPRDAFRRVRARRKVAAFSRSQWDALFAYGERVVPARTLDAADRSGLLTGAREMQYRLL